MPYHSEGISKNKKIKKERNKPLPLGLMKIQPLDLMSNETKRTRTHDGRTRENSLYYPII